MGRELVLKKIRKNWRGAIIFEAVLAIIDPLFIALFIYADEPTFKAVFIGLEIFLIVCTGICVWKYKNPMKLRCFKTNPRLLEEADELYSNVIYKDKFITYSDRIIANTKDITQMAAFEDIISVEESTVTYNCVSSTHEIILATEKYQIRINIYAKTRNTIDTLKYDIIKHCPNLKLKYAQG